MQTVCKLYANCMQKTTCLNHKNTIQTLENKYENNRGPYRDNSRTVWGHL